MFAVCFRQGIVQQMYVFFSSQLLRNLKSWPIYSIFHQFLMQQCTNPISTKFTGSEVKKKSWLTYVGFLVNTSFLVFCFYWSSSFQCYDWLFDCMPDQTNIECINTASSRKLNQAKYYSYYYRKLYLFLNVLHCSNLKSCVTLVLLSFTLNIFHPLL